MYGASAAVALASLPVGGTAANGQPPGHPQFQVNSYTTSFQAFPRAACGGTGNFVVVWASDGSGGSDSDGSSIQARLFDPVGNPLSAEFQVNTYTSGGQFHPDVAMGIAGDFVVVWDGYSAGSDTSYISIQGQRYSANGNPLGGEFQVNSFTEMSQQRPRVAASPDGGFIVVWESETSPGTDTDGKSVLARRFSADGTALGPDFQVNSYTTSWQHNPAIATSGAGAFVVVWTGPSAGSDTSYASIQARRFDPSGLPLGDDFQVNTYTSWVQFHSALAMLEGGEFVVAWASDGSDGSDQSYLSIQMRRFDAQGNPQGNDFQVNTSTLDYQNFPSISTDALGGFIVVWESIDSVGIDRESWVAGREFRFGTGTAGSEFAVGGFTTFSESYPAVAQGREGDLLVAWTSSGSPGPDTSLHSVQGRVFDGLFRDGFEGGDAGRWSLVVPSHANWRAPGPRS